MENTKSQPTAELSSIKFGLNISIITTILTIVTFGIAVCTPPLSGPFCKENCFEYPFLDIASRFPRDYFWMYPAIVLSFSYLIMMMSIHHITSSDKKLYSSIAVAFSLMSSFILAVDYFIQVSVIQPSILAGETEGIALLTQFNPHGIFIVLEEIGFLLMSISFFSLIPVFSGKNTLEKSIKWTAIIGFATTILSLIAISFSYGINREYRFEVTVISIVWLELIVIGILFSRYFLRLKKLQIQ